MNRAELIFPAGIFVVVAAFVAGGFLIGDYAWGVIAFPLSTAILTCALCAIEITRVLASHRELSAVTAAAPPVDDDDAQRSLSMSSLAWMFALLVFLYGLGFVAGPAVYLLVCLRANGFSWALSAGIAAGSVAMTWGLFIHVMGVLLPVAPPWWS